MQERSNTGSRFLSQRSLILSTGAIIVLIAAVVIAGIVDRQTSNDTVSAIAGLESIAWPRESTTRAPVAAAPTNVAPVGDLITGLEARLEQNPSDVKGWALLAQSYAFIADADGTEIALEKAVALGFDEADLRQRIELASRSPHATAAR